jgi:hypothetical protein
MGRLLLCPAHEAHFRHHPRNCAGATENGNHVFDDDVPGFGARARLSGSKVFVVQYSIDNKQRRMSLGKIEMVEVDSARRKAKQILTAERMGRDPAGDKRPSRV